MKKVKVVYSASYANFTLSPDAEQYLRDRGLDMPEHLIPRHHPLLVQCVEELGDKAGWEDREGGECVLDIHELKGFKYRIETIYDAAGMERVLEPEDTDIWEIVDIKDYIE